MSCVDMNWKPSSICLQFQLTNAPHHQPPLEHTRFHARHSTQLLPSFLVDVLPRSKFMGQRKSKVGNSLAQHLQTITSCWDL